MITPITVDDVLGIHRNVQEKYPSITRGRVDRGKIDDIIAKSFGSMYGQPLYDTIFKQAASLMEGIIRLHPFPDGNKRTALLTVYWFLVMNNHYLVIPFDTIRFLIGIANNEGATDKEIVELNNKIASWLEVRTATTGTEIRSLVVNHLLKPALGLLLISLTVVGLIYTRRKFKCWFAVDMHPEYERSVLQTCKFLLSTTWIGACIVLRNIGSRKA